MKCTKKKIVKNNNKNSKKQKKTYKKINKNKSRKIKKNIGGISSLPDESESKSKSNKPRNIFINYFPLSNLINNNNLKSKYGNIILFHFFNVFMNILNFNQSNIITPYNISYNITNNELEFNDNIEDFYNKVKEYVIYKCINDDISSIFDLQEVRLSSVTKYSNIDCTDHKNILTNDSSINDIIYKNIYHIFFLYSFNKTLKDLFNIDFFDEMVINIFNEIKEINNNYNKNDIYNHINNLIKTDVNGILNFYKEQYSNFLIRIYNISHNDDKQKYLNILKNNDFISKVK